MIQVHYGKPGEGMTVHPLAPTIDFRQTKAATKILASVDEFIHYFERVKGRKPDVVRLRQNQFDVLGVEPGKRRDGARLDRIQSHSVDKKPLAVFLFDYSGVMAQPWAEAGYDCLIVDIQHQGFDVFAQPGGTIYAHGADLTEPYELPLELASRNVIFVTAFPPCDHLATSGARWFKGKGLKALAWSIQCFAVAAEFAEAQGCPYCLENPKSTISTYWRKPDHIFHPHHFAGLAEEDHYLKTTCLWVGGGFEMPEPVPLNTDSQPDDRIHRCAPGPERKNIRSRTPLGFARAVFQANCPRQELVL